MAYQGERGLVVVPDDDAAVLAATRYCTCRKPRARRNCAACVDELLVAKERRAAALSEFVVAAGPQTNAVVT